MIYWLARAARTAREEANCKQVQVAAKLDRDQSIITRFESGRGWPRNPDEIVEGYAATLEISERELWERALALWQANGNG